MVNESRTIMVFPWNDPQTVATTRLHINTFNSSSTIDPNLKFTVIINGYQINTQANNKID